MQFNDSFSYFSISDLSVTGKPKILEATGNVRYPILRQVNSMLVQCDYYMAGCKSSTH